MLWAQLSHKSPHVIFSQKVKINKFDCIVVSNTIYTDEIIFRLKTPSRHLDHCDVIIKFYNFVSFLNKKGKKKLANNINTDTR